MARHGGEKPSRTLAIKIGFLLIPVAISLAVAAVLVTAVGRDPLEVVDALWKGAFKDSRKVGGVVNFWIPLTLVSIGLVVTFRAGLVEYRRRRTNDDGRDLRQLGRAILALGRQHVSPAQPGFDRAVRVLGGMFWALLVVNFWIPLLKIRARRQRNIRRRRF